LEQVRPDWPPPRQCFGAFGYYAPIPELWPRDAASAAVGTPGVFGKMGAAIRMQKPTLRTAAKGFALLIVVVASVYFLFEVVRHFSTIPSIEWNALTVSVMLLSLLGMLFVIFLGGVMWYLLLQDQGAEVRPRVAIEIVALSQVAKYLPGNMGHLVGQMTLATAAGIPIGVALSTMLISTLWLLAIGFGVGVLAVLFFVDAASTVDIPIPGTPWLAFLGLVLAGLPWFGVLFLNRYLPGLSRRLGGGKLVSTPRLGTALALGIGVGCRLRGAGCARRPRGARGADGRSALASGWRGNCGGSGHHLALDHPGWRRSGIFPRRYFEAVRLSAWPQPREHQSLHRRSGIQRRRLPGSMFEVDWGSDPRRPGNPADQRWFHRR